MASTQTAEMSRDGGPCDTAAAQRRVARANGRPRPTQDDAPLGHGRKPPGERNHRGSASSRAAVRQRRKGRRNAATPCAEEGPMLGTMRWRMLDGPSGEMHTTRSSRRYAKAEPGTNRRTTTTNRKAVGETSERRRSTRGAWPNDTKFSGERSESAATRCWADLWREAKPSGDAARTLLAEVGGRLTFHVAGAQARRCPRR